LNWITGAVGSGAGGGLPSGPPSMQFVWYSSQPAIRVPVGSLNVVGLSAL
jgi:hypothetical protein